MTMTPEQMRDARRKLGEAWGLGRPLTMSEMGSALRLKGKDPGNSIRDYETGKTTISGPLSVAIDLMLTGARLPEWTIAALMAASVAAKRNYKISPRMRAFMDEIISKRKD